MNGLLLKSHVLLKLVVFNPLVILTQAKQLYRLVRKHIRQSQLLVQLFVHYHRQLIIHIFFQPSPTIGQSAPTQNRTCSKTDEENNQQKLYTAASLIDAIITSQIHSTIAVTKPTNTSSNNIASARQSPKDGNILHVLRNNNVLIYYLSYN